MTRVLLIIFSTEVVLPLEEGHKGTLILNKEALLRVHYFVTFYWIQKSLSID